MMHIVKHGESGPRPAHCGSDRSPPERGGAHVWSRSFGGRIQHVAHHAAVSPLGEIALAGHFHGVIDFGGGPIESNSGGRAFVASFDAACTHCWSRVIGTGSVRTIHAVAFDRNDISRSGWMRRSVVLTGAFQGAIDFGGGLLASGDKEAILLVKLMP